jgi:methylenetetrahydrofolate dehydrogenase (NADP+)/methenyltetrahydrofolate cyclohydrolase
MKLFKALQHDGFTFTANCLAPQAPLYNQTVVASVGKNDCLTLDGRLAAQTVRQTCADLVQKWGPAHLAVILASHDPACRVYVNHKLKVFKDAGMESTLYEIPAETVTESGLVELICQLNDDPHIHGILVQLPLPDGISQNRIIDTIRPDKDVDGFSSHNVGLLHQGRLEKALLPCTPAGVIAMLGFYGISPEGKHAVVVGRSNIVGRPMAGLLLNENATVTIAHSKTENLRDVCRSADLLIVAAGRQGLVTKDDVRPGSVVVDVGMHRLPNGKLCGDVAADVAEVASFLTPVPGGVGPMTIAMLLLNTLRAAHLRQQGR